jgi:1,4-dihydroxy-6-naphthoate synthase
MHPRTLLAAISPCPNDTFCFQPWAEGVVESPISLSLSFHDVETLNIMARTSAPYDITKVSTACLNSIGEEYLPLSSGAAFAVNGGPTVVAKRPFSINDMHALRIAVPGRYTSAFVAFSILYGCPENIVEMPSSEILQSVVDGYADAGLVIHEARFVYPAYGLCRIVDIGDAYYSRFHTPLPLGVIVARRSLGEQLVDCLSDTLRRSIRHAKTQSSLSSFVSSHASEMHPDTIWQHISHYVTRETEMMADEEYRWIQVFLESAKGL